jgi:hypothetical protein
VHVPAANAAEVMESGQLASSAPGITFLRMENGAAVFDVVSGRYRFTTGTTAPGSDTTARDPQAPLKMRISTLMANDGEGLEFLAVDEFSVNGAALEVADGWIHYTPQPGNESPDSFSYAVRDAQGGIRSFTVNVGIIPADAPVQEAEALEVLPDGSRHVVFTGVPGRIYRIQSSETMSSSESWADRTTVQADEDGSFGMTDALPLPGKRFYRAVYP